MAKRRWGRLSEISHIRVVPLGPKRNRAPVAYDSLPYRLKHLASWRRMHALKEHKVVSRYGRRRGYAPSSDLRLLLKNKFITKQSKK
jgi:hypothetical protein